MGATVTGQVELERVLATIAAQSTNAILRPAFAAGLKVASKAMQAAVPAQFKDAKKGIGSRFNKSRRTNEVMAKAGAGVGIKAAKIKRDADKNFLGRAGRPGVGIGARNIHWFIMGTAQRTTGSKRIRSKKMIAKTGVSRMSTGNPVHSTGRMPAQMNPVQEGFENSAGAVQAKISEVATRCLLKLVQ